MDILYTDEKNTQIVLGLLKAHGIKKVIASPGTTNIRLIVSMQQDSWFEMYSAADERSAAYIACGLAAETEEPVVLSCTGATASRNYFPGLTEAFYRKLPILAITSTQHTGRIGQNIAQVVDRSMQPKDLVRVSVQLPTCHSAEDEWACNVQVNRAIIELKRAGGGPVHLNLETTYSNNFSIPQLPNVYPIYHIGYEDNFPKLPNGNIGIFVGAHQKWTDELTAEVDTFCERYNSVVLCDHTSNYHGKYRILFNLVNSQDKYYPKCRQIDLMIHIGNISGAYPSFESRAEWRINPDGEIRDTFQHLQYVFEMSEKYFFKHYNEEKNTSTVNTYYKLWDDEDNKLRRKLPELPFSNIWAAQQTGEKLPKNSILHLGILNSLRSWNFFEIPESIEVYCNTGGFGIDGIISASFGAALGNKNKLVFCVLGDLAFFYDMNVLGNRHICSNIRILLINNGKGTEFRNYNHPGAQFGEDSDEFIAAANHYGDKSRELVKHYATDLGFTYLTASTKEEYLEAVPQFVTPEFREKPMIFEVFTNWKDESDSLQAIRNLFMDPKLSKKETVKNAVKGIIGEGGFETLKRLTKKT